MAALRTALAARRLAEQSAAWSLLRSQNAPIAIAILGEHLAEENRELPAAELFEAVEADLSELRETAEFDLPQTAVQYCRQWLNSGYLVRRAGHAREELYALSDGALAAVRFVEELAAPRTSVTESRLTTIVERLHRLSMDTDPDVTRRIESLREERRRVDAQIAALESGDVEVLPEERAVEQAADVLALASELPEDFARLRTALEQINRDLRAQLIEDPDSRGTVLDDIFRGVDMLAESDAGRSFSAFYALVLDPESTAAFEDDVDHLMSRPFARGLTADQRHALLRLLPGMQEASGEIHRVMTSLSRSLRRFVQSQELAEDRRVNQLIRGALTEAHHVFADGAQPFRKLESGLDLTSVPLGGLSAMVLNNPADSASAEEVATVEAPEADLEQLREHVREAEIDVAELTENVHAVVAERGASTIAEILTHRPATQGAASVIGLLVLADQLATAAGGGRTEMVEWTPVGRADAGKADEGVPPKVHESPSRRARIPVHVFERTTP